jgi:hypothetical protein
LICGFKGRSFLGCWGWLLDDCYLWRGGWWRCGVDIIEEKNGKGTTYYSYKKFKYRVEQFDPNL